MHLNFKLSNLDFIFANFSEKFFISHNSTRRYDWNHLGVNINATFLYTSWISRTTHTFVKVLALST